MYFGSKHQAESYLDSVYIGRNENDPRVYDVLANRNEFKTIMSPEYKTLTEHINNYKYHLVNIPDVTAERSDYELDEFTGGPVKLPFGNEVSEGMFSINWMIKNFAMQVPFEFAKWEDCLAAAALLHEYTKLLEAQCDRVEAKCLSADQQEDFDMAMGYLHMAKSLDDYLFPLARRLHNYYIAQRSKYKAKSNILHRTLRDQVLSAMNRNAPDLTKSIKDTRDRTDGCLYRTRS